MSTPRNILITGLPKSGKTTLLRALIASFTHKVGFVTNEVRNEHGRIGFDFETYTGLTVPLARTTTETPHKVSRYFVDVAQIESILSTVATFSPNDILYLDEIGQMEFMSPNFEQLVTTYLDAPNLCIATLSAVYENEAIKRIKQRDDVVIVEITPENRDAMLRTLLEQVNKTILTS
jgi:nucleoside-triphosphatase THEP1